RTQAHVDAGLEAGASLAHDDAARRHELPAEALHAEPLRIRVPAVAGTADALLICHGLRLDLGNAHGAHRLSVHAVPTVLCPAVLGVVVPPLELDHERLGVLLLGNHLSGDPRGGQGLGLDCDLTPIADEQDLLELHGGAGGAVQTLDFDHLPRSHPVLLAARRDHRFHAHVLTS